MGRETGFIFFGCSVERVFPTSHGREDVYSIEDWIGGTEYGFEIISSLLDSRPLDLRRLLGWREGSGVWAYFLVGVGVRRRSLIEIFVCFFPAMQNASCKFVGTGWLLPYRFVLDWVAIGGLICSCVPGVGAVKSER